MPAAQRQITAEDIIPLDQYGAERKQRRAALVEKKKHRRIEVGPVATFYFENFESMLAQVQEMLYIEKGGDEQLKDELAAYNPMIPNGSELTATLMFEIDDDIRRHRILSRLGGVEDHIFLLVNGERIQARYEDEVERTNSAGKTSSVHFLHFAFTPAQIAAFRDPAAQVQLAIEHENYGHIAVVQPAVRAALAQDFA